MDTWKRLNALLGPLFVYVLGVSMPFFATASLQCGGAHLSLSPLSSESSQVWDHLEKTIMESVTRSLSLTRQKSYQAYDASSAHGKILERIFQLKIGSHQQQQTVSGILKNYELFMNQLIKTGKIKKEDVLRPAFLFTTLHGEIIWRRYGQEIPKGAKIYWDIISPEVYAKMIVEGFFPAGDATLTPTRIPTFQHDLAHLTSFMEHPHYMALIKKLGMAQASGLMGLSENLSQRMYFLNEGLMVYKNGAKDSILNLLLLSDSMKKSPSQVTLAQMEAYLKKKSHDELEQAFLQLTRDSDNYFDYMGGASREPYSRGTSPIHDPIRALRFNIVSYDSSAQRIYSVKELAKLQIFLLRLRDVSIEDWFIAGLAPQVPNSSPIFRLFDDPRIWENDNVAEFREAFVNP